jgi:hypothetical protein
MDNVVQWMTANWPYVMGFAYALISAAGQFVGMFDGPKADKARGIFDYILGILRSLGAGTYKDEPGTTSMPFKRDSGKRIVSEVVE